MTIPKSARELKKFLFNLSGFEDAASRAYGANKAPVREFLDSYADIFDYGDTKAIRLKGRASTARQLALAHQRQLSPFRRVRQLTRPLDTTTSQRQLTRQLREALTLASQRRRVLGAVMGSQSRRFDVG